MSATTTQPTPRPSHRGRPRPLWRDLIDMLAEVAPGKHQGAPRD